MTHQKQVASFSAPNSLGEKVFSDDSGHKWTATTEGGPSRVLHASVLIGDLIYIFGGCRLEDLNEEHEPIEIMVLHAETLKWRIREPTKQSRENVPFMRYGHSVVEHNGSAYLFGGRSSFKFCRDLFRYDPVAHLWERIKTTGCEPPSLLGHSMSVVGNSAFLYGGLENTRNEVTGEMYVLDFQTFEWSPVEPRGSVPSPRLHHSASVIDERIYVFGGQTRNRQREPQNIYHCNRIHYFDTETLTWHRPPQQGEVPSGRRSHSAFVYGGQIFIHGGHSDREDTCFGDSYRFDPITETWRFFRVHVGPIKTPRTRRCHTAVRAGNRVIMIGGVTVVNSNKLFMSLEGCPDEQMDWDGEYHHENNNIYVLDMRPTLKTLCMLSVIKNQLERITLPRILRMEMSHMFTANDVIRSGSREE